uniref:Uncharacterized protein n=1 Tax=Anguilla anguilla TaxID=7936 RepID=A0A0E9UBG0_ANGAN
MMIRVCSPQFSGSPRYFKVPI